MPRKEVTLAYFIAFWGGMHPSAWREDGTPVDPTMDFDHIKGLVQTAERGKFHCFFLADAVAIWPERTAEALARTSNAVRLEPFTLCAALAAITENIGLALTATTTYNDPFHIARKFSSLDHISGGRASWNVVTSGNPKEAENFGTTEHPNHEDRYRRAGEFVDVVKGLWDTWDDDAFKRDKQSGVYFDPDGMRELNHEGEFYSVRGPLVIDRPIQGYPVIAQAGESKIGVAFAAQVAELMFIHALPDLEAGSELYASLRQRIADAGRDPDDVLIMASTTVILGKTKADAEARLAALAGLLDPLVGLDRLSLILDFDLTTYPLDGPVPVDDIPVTEVGPQGLQKIYLDRARKENLTVRDMAIDAAADFMMPFGIEEMVEYISENFNRTCDGFNMNFADPAESLELFVDHVVPELQRRGIYHQDYTGKTLRENLGLRRPANRFNAGPTPDSQA